MMWILLVLVIGNAAANPCGSCRARHPAGDPERYKMRMCACFYKRCKKLHHRDYWKPSRKGALLAFTACQCCARGVIHFVRDPNGGLSNDRLRRWSRADEAARKCRKMKNELKLRKHFKYHDYVKQMVGKGHVCLIPPNRCYVAHSPGGFPTTMHCHTP